MKKIYILFSAAAIILSGCTVDVNELANSSAPQPNEVSSVSSDSDHTDVFYMLDSDTDSENSSDQSSDTDSQSPPKAFDESKYLTMYVTGSSEIPLMADAVPTSKPTAFLQCGEGVSIVQPDVMDYSFVYSAALEEFGYIPRLYLTDYKEEACIGNVMYVKPSQADVYADTQFTETAYTTSQNDLLTVLAERVDGKWKVMDKYDRVGYIDKNLLSDKKVKKESSKAESKKTNDGRHEPDTESSSITASAQSSSKANVSSEAVSSEEEIVGGNYSGKGDPPEEYTSYVCDVDVGYLSLRAAPDKRGKSIGEVYYEELIYVIDQSGDYWYVYVPSLSMYGYVTGDPNYLYPQG